MTEPMSDERLAEIRDQAANAFTYDDYHRVMRAVPELLAEVKRLRGVESRYRKRLERDALAQRAAYRRKHPEAQNKPVQLQPCGTSAAYQRHRRAGEQPCAPCRAAWREYQAAYYAKRKVAADAS